MILVNGLATDQVLACDRGLLYGDGVFRTLVMRDGRVNSWKRHYAKLDSDCSALEISCPDEEFFLRDFSPNPPPQREGVLRITVTRGESARGYAIRENNPVTRIVSLSGLPHFGNSMLADGVHARWCKIRLGLQPRLAGIKHLNRLENVLARLEWKDTSIFEGLICDERGYVIEGVSSNIVIRQGNAFYTPDLSKCGVAGVQRERLMEYVHPGIKVLDILPDMLMDADEVMICNSVIGLLQVRELEGRTWVKGEATQELRRLLEGEDEI